MGNYTLLSVSKSLHTLSSAVSGVPLHKVHTVTREYKEHLSKTGGMRLIKTHDLADIMSVIVASNIDAKLLAYILKHTTSKGEVKHPSKSTSIGISELSELFSVSRKKVSEFIKRTIDLNLIKKNKRALVINPYIISPHNTGRTALYALQTYWDSNFTYDITQELHQAELEYTASKVSDIEGTL